MYRRFAQILLVLIASAVLLHEATAADLKIGVVNIARVMEEAPQAQAARESLQKKFGARERELLAAQNKLREMEEKLVRDASVMSAAERERNERNIMARKRDMKRDQDEFRDDVNYEQSRILEGLQKQVVDTMQSFAKDNGFDLLLAEGVVYMSDKVDVTSGILKELQKQSK